MNTNKKTGDTHDARLAEILVLGGNCSLRNQNFHAGQRQAILNIIYLHEVAGNDLGMLERRYLRGSELEYLAELKDIMVINDEAHHIHELKRNGEIDLRPPAIMSICKVSLSAAMGELFV